MSDNGCLLYSKLVILLTRGCTKVMRGFIGQAVVNSTPEGESTWTLDRFLHERKARFFTNPYNGTKRRIDKRHVNLLYPYRQSSLIETWDLQLLVFVAIEMCGPLSDDVIKILENLRNIRNMLHHPADASVSEDVYADTVQQLKTAFEELLRGIDDQDVRNELTEAFKDVETQVDDLVYRTSIQQLDDWQESENPIHEKLNTLNEGQSKIMSLMEQLLEVKTELRGRNEILEANIIIVVKNCDAKVERFINDKLVHLLDPKLKANEHLHAELRDKGDLEIQSAIEEAVNELLAGNREITEVQHGCKLRIRCHSYEGLKDLFMQTVKGQITHAFKRVEESLRHQFHGAELEVIVTEGEYWRFITKIAKAT